MFLTPALMAFAVAAVCFAAGVHLLIFDWRAEKKRRAEEAEIEIARTRRLLAAS